DASQDLHVISPIRLNAAGGLQITLRGTTQLDGFPDAKAAFQNAASTWEALIQTPISIVIDVDFGPTWFGQQFPDNLRALTNPHLLAGDPAYPFIRANLLGAAADAGDQKGISFYNSLPEDSVPTDLGNTTLAMGPSALFRELGLVAPVANPDQEPPDWGTPPAIGFNSAFSYDFNPDDGIDAGKLDFEAMVLHEM